MIEIKHLKTLQALRNSGSLAAVRCIKRTKSALSHQFSDLEHALAFVSLCVKASRCVLRLRGNPVATGKPGAAADRSRPAGL